MSGFHSGDDDPFGLCVAPYGFNGAAVAAGDILVTDRGYSGADEVWAFSPAAPENERLVMPDPGNVDFYDLATGPPGTVYMCDALNPNALAILAPAGTLTSLPLTTPLINMVSIVYDAAARTIYVAEQGQQTIRRVDPATGGVTTIAQGLLGLTPCGLEIDVWGRRLWAVDTGANRVYEFCLPAVTAVDAEQQPGSGMAGERVEVVALRMSPNPGQSPTIHCRLSLASEARLEIFDLAGRLCRTLRHGRLPAGEVSLVWDGRDDEGRTAPAGVYLVRLSAGSVVRTARLALVR